MSDSFYDVVVVGAGPAGLGLALELGHRRVLVLLVERNERGGLAPRAKTTNTRTRAHLRRWGIADRLAAASLLGIDSLNDIHFVTSLAGPSLTVFCDAFNAVPARNDDYPEHAQWVPQYTLEKVMLERVRELPSVEVRFATAFETAEQNDETVTSTIRTGDRDPEQVVSRYLVGADGVRSAVRDLIGAEMQGTYGIARASNVNFRAPGLAAAIPHGKGVMFIQVQQGGISIAGPMDGGDVWYFGSGVREGEELDETAARAAIRRTTGFDLPFEILSKDVWVASQLLASRYSDRRIVLAGDACHLHPPFGGYGMNMGVGDAVDLGWKIAVVLQGWGAAVLIETYETERRPIHRKVLEEAVENHKMMLGSPWREGLDDDGPQGETVRREVCERLHAVKAREYLTLGTVLGLCVEDSPIIEKEGEPVPPQGGQDYLPSAYPGCLAPHGWLDDGRSLYDAFGWGFALLAADDAEDAQIDLARAEAATLKVPLALVRPGAAIMQRYRAKLALVRPDQIVAWRGDSWNGALAMATGRT